MRTKQTDALSLTHTYANASFIQVDVSYVSSAAAGVCSGENRRLSNVTAYDANGHYARYE